MSDSTPITFVGLDVHKDTIAVSVLRQNAAETDRRTIANTPAAVRKLVAGFANPGSLRVCYEAGPCGYELHRQLASLGVACDVIAPSLIPAVPAFASRPTGGTPTRSRGSTARESSRRSASRPRPRRRCGTS